MSPVQSNSSHASTAQETLQNSPEKKLEISDKLDFQIIDGIQLHEKDALKKSIKQKLEKDEQYATPLADKIPEISQIPAFAKEKAETKTEELNALAIGSVLAITELLESRTPEERRKIIKKGDFSQLVSTMGVLNPEEQKAISAVSLILKQKNLPENSAGKVIQDNIQPLIALVGEGMEAVDTLSPKSTSSTAKGFNLGGIAAAGTGAVGGALLGSKLGTVGGLFSSAAGSLGASSLYQSAENSSIWEDLGKGISDMGSSVKTGSQEFLKGIKENKAGAAVGVATVAALGYGLYKLFSGSEKSSDSSDGMGFAKKAMILGAIGLAGFFGLKNMDWVKDLLSGKSIGDMIEDGVLSAKDAAIEAGKKAIDGVVDTVSETAEEVIDTAKEKLSEADKKVQEFWEGKEDANGKRTGGKRKEWADYLEKTGNTQMAEILRGISTTQLEMGAVAGGLTSALLFRKIFLGGLVKKVFVGKGIPLLIGSFLLGKYLLGNDKEKGDLTQEEVLSASGMLKKIEKSKNEILKIYADEGIGADLIPESFQDAFSSDKIWEFLNLESEKEDGFFSENGKNIAKGGITILGGLMVMNALTASLKLLFSKGGVITGVVAFGFAMGWDITRTQNFIRASENVYSKFFQEKLREIDPNLLERFIPDYKAVQKIMLAMGITTFDYKISPENIDSTLQGLNHLKSEYTASEYSDFTDQVSILIEGIDVQKKKFTGKPIVLPTKAFLLLFSRAKSAGISFSVEQNGETFGVIIAGQKFSGFPSSYIHLLDETLEKTPEQIEASRKQKILEGMNQLKTDVEIHGVKNLRDSGHFTENSVMAVQKKISEISQKVQKGTSKDFTALDYDDLKNALASMKADMTTNQYGEILVTFLDEQGSLSSESTFAGISPDFSGKEFAENERLYDINAFEAAGAGYSDFFKKTTMGILSSIDEGQDTPPHMKALIEELKTNPEKIGTPKLWADIFIAIAQDYSDGNSSIGMTLFDTGLVLMVGGVSIPFEMGKDFISSVWNIIWGEFSLEKDLIENPATAVVSVGLLGAGIEKITSRGIIHNMAKGVRFTSLTVPTHIVTGTSRAARGGFSLLKETYIAGRILKSPEVRMKNLMSYGRGFREHITPTIRAKSKLIAELREAQRLKRLIAASGDSSVLFERRRKWSEQLDHIKNRFGIERMKMVDGATVDIFKGTKYENIKFDDLVKQQKNISIADSRTRPGGTTGGGNPPSGSQSSPHTNPPSGSQSSSHANSSQVPEGRTPSVQSRITGGAGASLSPEISRPRISPRAKKWAGVAVAVGGALGIGVAAKSLDEKWGHSKKDIFDESKNTEQVSVSEKRGELKLATEKLSALYSKIISSRPEISDNLSDKTGFSSFTEQKKLYTRNVHDFILNYGSLLKKLPEYKNIFDFNEGEEKTVFSLPLGEGGKNIPAISIKKESGKFFLLAPDSSDMRTLFLEQMEPPESLAMMIPRILPVSGDMLDFKDAYKNWEKGDTTEMWKSLGFGVFGTILTIGGVFTLGGTAAVNFGLRLVRITPKLMRLIPRASPRMLQVFHDQLLNLPGELKNLDSVKSLMGAVTGAMKKHGPNVLQNIGQSGFEIYSGFSRLTKQKILLNS